MNEYKENVSNFIDTLNRYRFTKTVDNICEYSPEADLYYRKIDNHKYLIFNHYNKKRKADLQGFDCWISSYNSDDEIGKKEAMHVEDVRLSFQIERDWHLIVKYL